MILLLTYIALISGGILVLLLLLFLLSGFDLDFDIDTDAGGGLGMVKGVLTFLSVGAWVVRLVLLTDANPVLAFVVGGAAGAVGVWILSLILKLLLAQQINVNWSADEAIMERGTVYLRIPAGGEGIVRISIKGTKRELKARSEATVDIPTGASVQVDRVADNGVVTVSAV